MNTQHHWAPQSLVEARESNADWKIIHCMSTWIQVMASGLPSPEELRVQAQSMSPHMRLQVYELFGELADVEVRLEHLLTELDADIKQELQA